MEMKAAIYCRVSTAARRLTLEGEFVDTGVSGARATTRRWCAPWSWIPWNWSSWCC